MEFEVFVRIFFSVIVVLVAMGIGSELVKHSQRHKERMLELKGDKTAEKAAQYASQVELLEQRMRVMERIATDRGVDLALEIEGLRDTAGTAAPRMENAQ